MGADLERRHQDLCVLLESELCAPIVKGHGGPSPDFQVHSSPRVHWPCPRRARSASLSRSQQVLNGTTYHTVTLLVYFQRAVFSDFGWR